MGRNRFLVESDEAAWNDQADLIRKHVILYVNIPDLNLDFNYYFYYLPVFLLLNLLCDSNP